MSEEAKNNNVFLRIVKLEKAGGLGTDIHGQKFYWCTTETDKTSGITKAYVNIEAESKEQTSLSFSELVKRLRIPLRNNRDLFLPNGGDAVFDIFPILLMDGGKGKALRGRTYCEATLREMKGREKFKDRQVLELVK